MLFVSLFIGTAFALILKFNIFTIHDACSAVQEVSGKLIASMVLVKNIKNTNTNCASLVQNTLMQAARTQANGIITFDLVSVLSVYIAHAFIC